MAELALAIVPLITSALENYSRVSKAISRYTRFSEHLEEFRAEFEIQCAVFQGSLRLLLLSVVGDEQAGVMLQDADDDAWQDTELNRYLSERFSGRTASAIRQSLDHIGRQLSKLQAVNTSFETVLSGVKQNKRLPLRKKVLAIGKKIELACSESQIDELLKSLRARTRDFRVLVRQSECLTDGRGLEDPSRRAQEKVLQFEAVKSAANNLYTAFSQACTKHREHQGYIGLQPTHGTRSVDFVLAFKSLTIQPTVTGSGPPPADVLWFTVASTISESKAPATPSGVFDCLKRTAKRALDATLSDSANFDKPKLKSRPRKTVTFQQSPDLDNLPSRLRPPPVADTLVNLCRHNNFCNQVQKVFVQPKLPRDRCIGYLQSIDSSQHLVYIHTRMQRLNTVAQMAAMVTLQQLLNPKTPSTELTGFGALHRRIHICKQLALALLQFHRTRWIKESWSSKDIVISSAGVEEMPEKSISSNGVVHESYATVSIDGGGGAVQQQKTMPLPYIRNRALFNLGKIFLEIAFRKGFQQLDKPGDLDDDLTADSIDFFVAKGALCSVSETLGTRFSELVRKCIECDFGQGDDFTSQRLQASFYQHVICELETCEELAKRLNSNRN